MAQSLGSFAADAPRFAIDLAAQNGAYYAKADAKGAEAVDSLQGLTGDLVLTSTNASVTITTSGQNIDLSAAGGAVVGTANQIGVVTAAGTSTVSLAAPSPAPTAGTYVPSSLTVDGLGRVTAIQGGAVPSVPYFGCANNNAQDNNRMVIFGNTNNAGVDGTANYYNMNYVSATIGAFMKGVGFTPLLANHIYRWSMNAQLVIYNPGASQPVGKWYMGLNTDQDAAPLSTPNSGSLVTPYSYIFAQSAPLTTIGTGFTSYSNFSASTLVIGKGKIPCMFFATDTPLTPYAGDPTVGGFNVEVDMFGSTVTGAAGPGGCLTIEDLGLGTALSGTPAAPVVSPTTAPTANRIDVQWNITGLTAYPAPNFQLLIGTSNTGPFVLPASANAFTSLGNGVFSGYVTGLTTATTYYFTVSANNGIGPLITSPASAGITTA